MRNRIKTHDELLRYEYKNVSGTIQWVTYTDEFGDLVPTRLDPNKTVWFTEPDLRRYKKSHPRFQDGSIVPVSNDPGKVSMTIAENIMTDIQLEFFVKNCETSKLLEVRSRKVTSLTTLARIREECKRQDKPVSFIDTIDRKIEKLQEDERQNRAH